MGARSAYRGIIWDMDNTLLKSNIDFGAMKQVVFDYLTGCGMLPDDLPLEQHTTSTMIEHARQQGLTDDTYRRTMEIAARFEMAGMEDAGLEKNARELLDRLRDRFVLTIVTNNSLPAAIKALETTGIASYFKLIAGREQMSAMKPSPSGFIYVMERFPDISSGQWIAVGDSWIDGKAAMEAGVPFIRYMSNQHNMAEKGVTPLAQVEDLLDILSYV